MVENLLERKFNEKTGMDFNKCYKEYMPKLIWYLASRMTKNVEKAEEYAHRAFIQGLEKIDTYDLEKSQLITWLTQISKNLVIKDYKDAMRYDSVSLDAEIEDTPGIINMIGYDGGEEENELHEENVKKCEIIKNTFMVLPEKYKKVMIMREIQRMHYKDIADAIKKEEKINLKIGNKIKLSTPEDFYSLQIDNIKGTGDVKIHFININHGVKNEFKRVVAAGNSLTIVRDEIEWERNPNDIFDVISESMQCNVNYITTTNLSTIKSQIKKGRSLVKSKVTRKFKNLAKI